MIKKLILFVPFTLLLSCEQNSDSTIETKTISIHNELKLTASQLQTANLSFDTLENKFISNTLKLNGKIDVPPQNLVSVSIALGGYLKNTKLLPGMYLKKGEVIATLEDQSYIQLQEDYLITKSKLELTELEYERQRDLNNSKATSDKQFQLVKSEYQNLRISLNSLSEKLKLINLNPKSLNENNISRSISLTAPFNGFVSKVNVNVGKYVNPTDVLFELVDPNDIHLNVYVFEKDLSKLSIGQKMIAYTNSEPEKKYNCEILLISQDVSNDRTSEVHCHFLNYNKSLLPGMFMNVEIELQSTQVQAIQEKAIVTYEGKNYVFIKEKKDTFKLFEISTGKKENGWIEILNSSEIKGKQIVKDGAYTLLMALKNKADE